MTVTLSNAYKSLLSPYLTACPYCIGLPAPYCIALPLLQSVLVSVPYYYVDSFIITWGTIASPAIPQKCSKEIIAGATVVLMQEQGLSVRASLLQERERSAP